MTAVVALWEGWAAQFAVHAFHSAATPDGIGFKWYLKGNLTMSQTERRPRLTAARKLELYLATRSADAPLGEILRQYGVHLDDLRAIERVVESSALAGLKAQSRHGRQPTDVSPERVQQLEEELAEKTRALAELGVSFALLEKKDRAESRSRSGVNGSRRRNAR